MARELWLYTIVALFILRNMPCKVDVLDVIMCAAIIWLLLQDGP